jgi:hypothetical protein
LDQGNRVLAVRGNQDLAVLGVMPGRS